MKSFIFTLITLVVANGALAKDLSLWYEKPADLSEWEQALPLGNGRLGAMVFGGIDKSMVILNEDSIWSGWAEPRNDREGSYEALLEIRKLLKEKGDPKQVEKLALKEFCSLYGYGRPDFGCYQSFCNAEFEFGHDPETVSNYRRDLDLETAVATVSYMLDGVNYKREYFCSYPDNALVVRISADKPGKVNFTLGASSLHKAVKVTAKGDELVVDGQVSTKDEAHPGVKFQGIWQVKLDGGSVGATDGGDKLEVKQANSVVIVMVADTNYKLEYPTYKGKEPEEYNRPILSNLSSKSYDELRNAHVQDYRVLFDRMRLDLGSQSREELPVDQRLEAYKKDKEDRGLEELLFQYGRYLLIASSRPGGLPANLQGLWNNSNKPMWNCDYHLNINFQMNYWPVNQCNLAECAEPMIRWTQDLVKPGEKTAKVHYNSPGWVAHHACNVWGFTSPGPKRGVWMLEAESGAFLCQNIWDYYAYTQDKKYLEEVAWPILKGAAEFWVANLQEVEGGYLAVSPSYSPEHGPLSDGAYYQTMIMWDLFTNCIAASEVLGQDKEFAEELARLRDRLQPLKIGEYGQLCEWRDPELEKNANKDKHRHVSQMYAVYPSKQIIAGTHNELTEAAIKSMNFRGDAATGWSMGWKINLWARLLDGDRAHRLVQNLLSKKIYTNLWDAHPPFQIDGNFGYMAGVAEMLVQSHTGEIVLLPALPQAWHTGSVKGLCVRGGFMLDMSWKDGRLVSVTLHNLSGQQCVVRYGENTLVINNAPGEQVTWSIAD